MVYILNQKKNVIETFRTTPSIEKAIRTLLLADEELVYSKSHEGYTIVCKEVESEG